MKKFRLAMVAVLAASLALTACSSKPTQPAPADKGAQPQATTPAQSTATFKYYLVDKPTTFDPAMVSDVSTMQIIQNVYSGLVQYDEKGELVNDMAAKIDVSTDGKTYTFTLKDGIKFHDGTAVTAEDLKRSMLRAMNPALGSPVNDVYLDDIAGYNKFLATQSKLGKDLAAKTITEADQKQQLAAAYDELKKNSGIEAKDAKTLVVNLADNTPYFLAKLTYPTAWPVPKSVPEDKPLDASPANAKLMIGTGPFKMDTYVEGSKVTLKANPDFYGAKAKIAGVDMQVISSDQAELAAYRSGQIDMSPIPPADYKTIKADPSLSKEILEYATARINYLALNQGKLEAAKDVRVRQAVSMAINKDQLVEVVYGGTYLPADGILPDGIPGALGSKVQGLKFDPAKAKDLLKQAGYGEGGKPFTFTLTYRAKNETSQRWAEFVQNQLKTNLGVTIQVEPMEWSALLKASQAKDQLESFLLGWSADYIDPQDFMTILLHGGAPNNRYGYANKDVDAILDKADHAKAGADRFAEYGKAEQIAVTEQGFIPQSFPKSMFLVRSTVKGVRHNVMGILPLNTVEYTK
jgi:oligopeptide transport system substrate-binding protein